MHAPAGRMWRDVRMSNLTLRSIAIVALAAIAAIAVACGGDDDSDDPTAPASTPAETQAASTESAGETPAADPTAEATSGSETPASNTPGADGATVQLGAAGLVDSGGFSLYFFASDVADSGQSACVGGCAAAWPPLIDEAPTAGAGVSGTVGSITRVDGSNQVTYNGKPLYRWVNDKNPGDTTGTGIANWSLAQP